jgi:protease secretion system membrane fusion protein
MSAVLPPLTTSHATRVDLDDARPRRWGWFLLLVGLGSFLAWAAFAPLDAAVTTSGTVVVSGSRKLVQSVAGGKVVEIAVREGDTVAAGQVLLRLDSTQSQSQLDLARGQWLVAMGTQARLQAEQRANTVIDFPPTLLELGNDARVAEVMELQAQLLESRRQMRSNELQSMEASLRGLEFQVQGHEAARRTKEAQGRMLREELRNQQSLADDGFFPRNRISEQERVFAGIQGGAAEDSSSVGKTRQAIAEIKARIAGRQQETRKEIESQLSDVQRESAGLESRIQALEADVANTDITAPVAGTVMAVTTHTVGGVVAAGAPLMELVPLNDPLRVEAQLPARMIDKVKPGLSVNVLFSALNQASTPLIEGKVVQVAPDAMADTRQNQSYFKLVVEVAPQSMPKLMQHEIRAGMPAEVFIKTGERTFMNYLLKPLLDRMNQALIEP